MYLYGMRLRGFSIGCEPSGVVERMDDTSGKYWDAYKVDKPEYNSFMRYALHRSAKREGFLQFSVMEIGNGEMIPTSDSQHDSAEDFINRRVWMSGAETITII